MSTVITEQNFQLDAFQLEAIKHIQEGNSVIVCAPTGAGKTVIAREAIRQALAENKKVFYTAPLKALINQKYYEFSAAFGEAKVGIVTGDTNKNRDAQIIVMTTEIYRNMLYGTTFGSIDPFLHDLKFVIFDEFHFINDDSRGTVWEESVIYSPKSVKLIALSATINNPNDLVDWISEVHGLCKLVKTDFRPVPLHHYYFKDEQLAPLLTPNLKLNPKLKEHDDNRFGKKHGKFNRFHNGSQAKASIAKVVEELHKKEMLPAIYFVFSRKGCDKASEECENLKLLSANEEKELNANIDLAIAHTPHIGKYSQIHLLRRGIAAHHAGLLPQVKSLIEELFTKSLVKVVFSTETLAAGINMPARSTVIHSISKATDEGFRNLKPSEFLQMSGRAGRRGMDEAGYVITVKNGNSSAAEVAFLANAKPEDVSSHFNASYEMVLNLLLGHEFNEMKALLEKSFGQSLINRSLIHPSKEAEKLNNDILDLQHPLCPGEIGDLNHYHAMQNKLDETRKLKKLYEKNLDPAVDELEAHLEILTMEAKNYPCNGCPKQKPCSKQMDKIKRYRKQLKDLEYDIERRKSQLWIEFEAVINLLRDENYLDQNYKATEWGRTCAALRSDNSFYLTELIKEKIFDNIDAPNLAGLISCFVIGEGRARDKDYADASSLALDLSKNVQNVARKVIKAQRNAGIYKPVDFNTNISAVVERWSQGITWEELIKDSRIDEGDILRAIRRTVDLARQISKAPNIPSPLQSQAAEVVRALERDIVIESL